MTYITVLLLMILFPVIVSSCQTEFKIDVAPADQICPEEWRISQTKAPSDISCAIKCSRNRECMGVMYDESNKTCIECGAYNCKTTMGNSRPTDADIYMKKYRTCNMTNSAYTDEMTPVGVPPSVSTMFAKDISDPFPAFKDNLVSGVRPVPDTSLRASSTWENRANHGPNNARLCAISSNAEAGAWVTTATDQHQWIQVRFFGVSEIVAIATAGRATIPSQYVSAFRVSYSTDCTQFVTVNDVDGNAIIFPGNKDGVATVYNDLPYPVHALCVRINPTSWFGFIAMRMDVIGYEI